jgi:DNA-binding IclR family transcriptional regulator
MKLNAIEKALMILTSFKDSNRPMGTIQLAKQLEIHKATVSRVLATLKKYDFVDQDPRSRLYRLGPAVATLAQALNQSMEGQIAVIAQPYLDELRDFAQETVHLEIEGGNYIYLASASRGPQALSVSVSVGDRTWPHVHAGAKAIAAFSAPKRLESMLAGDLPVFTEHTITDPGLLMVQYKQIRETGIAYDRGELDDHIYAMGAPIFNHESKPVAAVVVIAPSFRFKTGNQKKLIDKLQETAATISTRLLSKRS